MKLNTKRVCLVGTAFFLICAFWQAYDAIIPITLKNKFGYSETQSGFVMALDNIFAIFLLPLFGAISDKSRSRFGKRTPFIVIGTICAIVSFVALTIVDNAKIAALQAGEQRVYLSVLFIGALLCSLLSMAVFRSPAVALMPDVVVKPLRSRANAIINLMGAVGGILVLGLGILFGTGKQENVTMSYTGYVLAVCGLMFAALLVFVFTVKEPKWNREMLQAQALLEDTPEPEEMVGDRKLTRSQLVSLILILSSVVLWFFGYNAVTSKFSSYSTSVLGMDFNSTLMIAQAAAIVSYIPVGFVASRLGRKKTILIGIGFLFTAFLGGTFLREHSPVWLLYFLFVFAGIGWATINVNSFPMVVELSAGGNIGKYTGYYYTASMAAQIATPVACGFLMDYMGKMEVLFPYAAFFVACSFVTMLFVRHGDAQEKKI